MNFLFYFLFNMTLFISYRLGVTYLMLVFGKFVRDIISS